MKAKEALVYGAKTAYESREVVGNYEADRFSSLLGRYRHAREQRAARRIIDALEEAITVLDCPCGNGRWWPMLRRKASSIVAVDISEEMVAAAGAKAARMGFPVRVSRGDAENLLLEDDAVDYVFSFALTKHLPPPVQLRVLQEFARVARRGVVCSFGIFTHLTYELWRRRGLVESYPLMLEQLEWMAREAGLSLTRRERCTTPVGVEHIVLLEKAVRQ
jgi:ubiquinone/menaquinone biosynthesis C-methylase UbiE